MDDNRNNKNEIAGFRGHSLAMYSNWLWHRGTRSMFDAGEGIGLSMRNHVFAIDKIFISHGHHDHFGGLPGLSFARGAARGDKGKPFSVYHPGGWRKINALKAYIGSAGDMGYEIKWIEVSPGDEIVVSDDGKTMVRPFKVEHVGPLCLGYTMVEKRFRLRSDLVGRPEREIAEIARKDGKQAVRESYEKVVMAYSGDASGVPVEVVREADVLFHEATFVEHGDLVNDESNETAVRMEGGHSSVRSAVETASKAKVGHLVLMHLSTRFTVESAIAEAVKAVNSYRFMGKVSFLHGYRVYDVV